MKRSAVSSPRSVRPRAASRGPIRGGGRGRVRGRGVRGFTLTELMVAVLVMIVIILASSTIFSTASKVTGVGQGMAELMAEASALEAQMRQDLERLDPAGIFAIRGAAVANNVHLAAGGTLLNPLLPPNAILRADQLLFFTNAAQSQQVFRPSQGVNHKAQSAVSRVYYGHAFQLPEAQTQPTSLDPAASWPDPASGSLAGIYPWTWGPPNTLPFAPLASTLPAPDPAELGGTFPGMLSPAQPPARSWVLARQAALLADDGGSLNTFLQQGNSAESIWSLSLRNGRFDGAATQMNDIRDLLMLDAAGTPLTWNQQRDAIGQAMSWPRAEREPHSMDRMDHALTTSIIGSGCSSIIIDWTYDAGVGQATNGLGVTWNGAFVDSTFHQPWFGLDYLADGTLATGTEPGVRGVMSFTHYCDVLASASQPQTLAVLPLIVPLNNPIERMPAALNTLNVAWPLPGYPNGPVRVYEAFFGFNQDQPLGPPPALVPVPNPAYAPARLPAAPLDAEPRADLAYTPWPSAIRVTLTLHDIRGRIEGGREFQFVIRLPKRGSS